MNIKALARFGVGRVAATTFSFIESVYKSKRARNVLRTVVPAQLRHHVIARIKSLRYIAPKLDVDLAHSLADKDFVIIVNTYPGVDGRYGGEFVQSRAKAYLQAGYRGAAVELNRSNARTSSETHGNFLVLRLHAAHSGVLAAKLAQLPTTVLAHSPTPALQSALMARVPSSRLVFFYHGFDVRDYRRLSFNYTTQSLAPQRKMLDETNRERHSVALTAFQDNALRKVFVSNFLRDLAQCDVKTQATNSHIVPNFIDGELYRARAREASEVKNILLLRSFSRRNYGNDIAIEALRIVSTWPGFDNLNITIRGFGDGFEETVLPLRNRKNVVIENRYSTSEEMAELYDTHGVFLCPSRFETQGVTLGQAMASGLVCVTNDIPGLSEFVDDSCVVLAKPDDPLDFAKAIWSLVSKPEYMPQLSAAASRRVRAQCGYESTVAKEIALFAQQSSSEQSELSR